MPTGRATSASGSHPEIGAPAATIVPYEDGPYLVRGAFVMRDQDGGELAMTRRTVALCRCGKSRTRPLCDGTHRAIGFKAPSSPERWPSADDAPGPSPPTRAASIPTPPGGQPGEADAVPVPGAPGEADRAILEALAVTRQALRSVRRSLDGPVSQRDQAAMSLAQPLLEAAVELLGDPSLARRLVMPRAGARQG